MTSTNTTPRRAFPFGGASLLIVLGLTLAACGKKDETVVTPVQAPGAPASSTAFPAGNTAGDVARIRELMEKEAAEREALKADDKKWMKGLREGLSQPQKQYKY